MIKISKKSFFVCLLLLLLFYALFFCVLFEKNYKTKHGYSFFFGKRPLISVLVTSYNYGHYLRQTLDSILAQTYKKYEVIIVDDGSTDNSVELIKEYTQRYPNFHLYQHEGGVNKGLPASVKFGVEKAKGEYVAFLESDDHWHKAKLEKVAEMINKHPNAVIISNNVTAFAEDTKIVWLAKSYINSINKNISEENFIESDSLFNTIPTLSAVTIKTSNLVNLDFNPPISVFLDLWIYNQIFAKYPLYYLFDKLTYWRKHPDSFGYRAHEFNEQNDDFIKKLKEITKK